MSPKPSQSNCGGFLIHTCVVRAIVSTPFVAEFPSTAGIHKLGGKSSLLGAICPNCNQPLTRFFHLVLTDPLFDINKPNLRSVDLLFCWQCPLAQSEFSYQLTSEDECKVLACAAGPKDDEFPYADYPRWFPEVPMEFLPLSKSLAQNIELDEQLSIASPTKIEKKFSRSELDVITTPRHQLGGTPLRFTDSNPICPLCQTAMQFLMTIADSSTDPRGFVGYVDAQVVYHLCPKCSVLTATQECD
jgi:hypothetical protein